MKKIVIATLALFLCQSLILKAQVEQYDPASCSTPHLDSANAVALPYYANNQILSDYLTNNGYYNLEQISFPNLKTTATFLEPKYLIPLTIYIYRDGSNDPNSSIDENDARDYICRANDIFRTAGSSIQFYIESISFEGNNFFNQEVSTNLHIYDMWSRKRLSDGYQGINVHFIRYNLEPQAAPGKATLPHYPVAPYSEYSLFVRTHTNPSGTERPALSIAATLAHEVGHTLGLLHTHHPGRLTSVIQNSENGTISNGCYQESVSRTRENKWYDGCFSSNGYLKCEINGDFLCDTEADPRQTLLVDGTCTYIHPTSGDFLEDNWGVDWLPPTNNVMSYTIDACSNDFSKGQTAIMWMQVDDDLKSQINLQEPIVSSNKELVCDQYTTTFTLSNFPSEASVSWHVEPSSLVTTATGSGSSATISAASSITSGSGEIIFTISGPNNCYIQRVSDEFWIGNPAKPGTIDIAMDAPPKRFTATIIEDVETATSYKWYIDGVYNQTTSTSAAIFNRTATCDDYYFLEVQAVNDCGSGSKNYKDVYGPSCSGDDPFLAMVASPNPSSEETTIAIVDFEDSSEKLSPWSIYIFNENQTLVFEKSDITNKRIHLNTRGFKNGLYFIHGYYKGEVLRSILVVNN